MRALRTHADPAPKAQGRPKRCERRTLKRAGLYIGDCHCFLCGAVILAMRRHFCLSSL